jgi:hypothetical protein
MVKTPKVEKTITHKADKKIAFENVLVGLLTDPAWIDDISIPKKEAMTPENNMSSEAEEKSGMKLFIEKEMWIGWPCKYHVSPRAMMRKLGINVPHTAPTVLIQEEILSPKKLAMVAPQNRARIKLTM